MVRLGSNRWKGLYTEGVILNEGGWQRKWIWNRGTGETALQARRGNIRMGTIFWGKGTLRGVTVGVVITVVLVASQWKTSQ